MTQESVLYDKRDKLALITMNRADALNALDHEMRRQLMAALEQASVDPDVGAVVLTGSGRAFSVGQDVGELKRLYEDEGPELGRLVEEEYAPLLTWIRDLPKPLVAAVNGPAAGGGMALALAADIRLATPKASFIPAFVKVGLVPDSGASFSLVQMLGLSKAMELTLLGEALGAEEAHRLGLVRAIFDTPEALLEGARELASRLADGPRLAYPAIKELLHTAASAGFEEVLSLETEAQDRLGRTRDHQEAVVSFLEKRPPRFEGR